MPLSCITPFQRPTTTQKAAENQNTEHAENKKKFPETNKEKKIRV